MNYVSHKTLTRARTKSRVVTLGWYNDNVFENELDAKHFCANRGWHPRCVSFQTHIWFHIHCNFHFYVVYYLKPKYLYCPGRLYNVHGATLSSPLCTIVLPKSYFVCKKVANSQEVGVPQSDSELDSPSRYLPPLDLLPYDCCRDVGGLLVRI